MSIHWNPYAICLNIGAPILYVQLLSAQESQLTACISSQIHMRSWCICDMLHLEIGHDRRIYAPQQMANTTCWAVMVVFRGHLVEHLSACLCF